MSEKKHARKYVTIDAMQIECQKECHDIECQSLCQKEYQIECQEIYSIL